MDYRSLKVIQAGTIRHSRA